MDFVNVAEPDELDSLRTQLAETEKRLRKSLREAQRLERTIEQERLYAVARTNQLALRTQTERDRERFLQLLLTNAPSLIVFFDTTRRLVHCTDSFLAAAGIAGTWVIEGKDVREVFGAFCDDGFTYTIAHTIDDVIKSNAAIAYNGETKLRGGDEPRKYIVNISPMINPEGANEGALLVLQDSTAIELAREEAERASVAKTDFLSNMSHEIRTPMNAIIGMTTIARESDEASRKDYCLEKIDGASKHLLGILNDILDMSKIEANKLELSVESFDFEKMLQKVVDVVRFRVEERDQLLSIQLDPKVPAALLGDNQRLAQVIVNLLSNAVKFTPEGGDVTLGVSLVKEALGVYTVQVDVSDTGIGISPEQRSRLFIAFQQADSGTSRKFGGTGLGLAISKRIVEMMNGEIWVDSILGEGSTFSFTIKLRAGEEAAADKPDVEALKALHILVLDDDDYTRERFATFEGPSWDIAANNEEFHRLAANGGRYDICFIGVETPGVTEESIRRLRQTQGEETEIIMLAAKGRAFAETDLHAAGADRVLLKPLFRPDIHDCLRGYIASPVEHIAPEEEGEAKFTGKRILLVEDVEINREIVISLLEPTEVEIVSAENGYEAVQTFQAEEGRFDIVFMDIQMPEMDGHEATRLIRALDIPAALNVPIVAMSANVFREDIERCLESGMDDHIGKPLAYEDIIEKLLKYL